MVLTPGNWSAEVDVTRGEVVLRIAFDPEQMAIAAPALLRENRFPAFINELTLHYTVQSRAVRFCERVLA